MFRLLRRMRRDERGQAIILGAVAMLILAVMVLSSVSIGHGVYSKIKTQDAADAQSYSIAVKQARVYNFIAYTNRAMVVHYSAMLTITSYVSHALYLDKTVGTAAKYLKVIPGVGAIFAAIENVIKAWVKAVDIISRVVIPILTAINVGLWLAQEALLTATYFDLFQGRTFEALKGTDPQVNYGFFSGGPGDALNELMDTSNANNFLHVLDDGVDSKSYSVGNTGLNTRRKLLSQDNVLSEPKMAKYRLLMGNLANGARKKWTAVGEGPFLLGRKWSLNLCLVVGSLRIDKIADSQIKSFTSADRRDELFASDDIDMSVRVPCGPISKKVFGFQYRVRVAANKENGFHQARFGSGNGAKTDSHHPWQGITPFVLADPSYWSPWTYHFGYPCNVVFASKEAIFTRQVFQLKTNFMVGKGKMVMDEFESGRLNMSHDKVLPPKFIDATGGMLAMSVGRAIYHRPGDWKEQPNFFNPLWTARLAPISTHWEQDLMTLMIGFMAGWENVGPANLNY